MQVERYQPARVRAENIGDLPAPGSAQAARTAQAAFANLAQRLGSIADRNAARKGEMDGAAAGLDPEFRPERTGTIYGDAYDQAGLRVMRVNTEAQITAELARLHEEHPEDIEAFNAGAAQVQERYIEALKDIDPQGHAELTARWPLQTLSYGRQYARVEAAARQADESAAAINYVETQGQDIERQAYALGLDEAADATLATMTTGFEARLIEMGPRTAFTYRGVEYEADDSRTGALSVEQIETQMQATTDTVAIARVRGQFDRLETREDMEAYRADLQEDYEAGEGVLGLLSWQQMDQLDTHMRVTIGELRAEENRQAADRRAFEATVREQRSILRDRVRNYNGFGAAGVMPNSEEMSQLRAQARALNDQETLRTLDAIENDAREARNAMATNPIELRLQINDMRGQIQDGASPEEVQRLTLLEDVASGQATALARDPYSYAVRAGIVQQTPIFQENEDGVQVLNLPQRLAQSRLIEQTYGVRGAMFTAEELDSLQRLEEQGGANLLAATVELANLASEDEMLAVYDRLAPDAPLYTNLAALISEGGSVSAVTAATNGARVRAENPGVTMPAQARQRAERRLNHLSGSPATQAIVRRTADLIYLGRYGAASEFNSEGYDQALQEAQGANGEYGGQVTIGQGAWDRLRTSHVVAPTWLRRDELDSVISSLTAEDYAAAGSGQPSYADGSPVPVDVMRRAYFLPYGPGRMVAYLNDPDGDDPRPVAGSGPSGLYVLDLNEIKDDLKERYPEAVR